MASFGIEFEFDIIKRDGSKIMEEFYAGRKCVDGWDYQCDYTCAVELRSPVWTKLDQAVQDIKHEFNYWCEVLSDYAPYAYNSWGRRLGMHIHIGLPQRELLAREMRAIGRASVNVYPLLASLQAQPVPSERGLTANYARPVWRYDWKFPNTDHYCEISASNHGTVEFRIFDSNIPQVALVNAWFLKSIAEKVLSALDSGDELNIYLMKKRYLIDRMRGLRYGINALDVKWYINYLMRLLGDVELPRHKFFRELLYLAIKYGLTPYNILKLSRANEFYYFRNMFCNPDVFIENFMSLMDARGNDFIARAVNDAVENALRLERLSDLLALASVRELPSILEPIIPDHSKGLPRRSYVRECVERGAFRIARIFEVHNMSVEEVADRISYLLKHHGNGYVNVMSPYEVINDRRRFYVFTVRDAQSGMESILGCIAVRVSTGEVSSLVVDNRYRRLGIARRLIEAVRNVAERPLYGYVKASNEVMISLLRSVGFELRRVSDSVLLFHTPGDERFKEGC